jgi:pimeloyl-ACP methyl ester carboxylesterase
MLESPFTITIGTEAVRGTLHLPGNAGPYPAVLWLHGFGGTRVESHRLFVDGARQLARAGVASLRIDFRGAGESDGETRDMTIASQIQDARAALGALRTHPNVDSTRLALLGYSLGAAIASQIGDEAGLAAMVFWSPVVFPAPIFARMGLYAAHPELSRQGWIDAGGRCVGRDFLAELTALDPLGALANWRQPLLVLSGSEDTVATSENAAALLEEVVMAEGEILPGANHVFGSVKSRTWLLERSSAWLGGRLAGVPCS